MCKAVQENTKPSSGAHTIGFFRARTRGTAACRTEKASPELFLSDSRKASVTTEIVTEPRAIEVATVTRDLTPKTSASKGKPMAAMLGKLTVSASTELSEEDNFSPYRAQEK